MTASWKEELEKKLVKDFGTKQGQTLCDKYRHAFPAGYTDEYNAGIAVADVPFLEKLSDENSLELEIYLALGKHEHTLHIRLYQWREPIPLADILPMLENLDLRAYNERPHKVTPSRSETIWVSDFSVSYNRGKFDIEKIKATFQEAFIQIYKGRSENDGFNKLILGASLAWDEIIILRMYSKYLRQIGFRFSQSYIEKALADHPDITTDLVRLFELLHNPNQKKNSKADAKLLEKKILSALDNVSSLDEDRIIRHMLELIKATLRTNYYLPVHDGSPRDYLSIKLNSRRITDMPLPKPMYEIFVYSPQFEGIHLRNSKVARGGIRWSTRPEDFRTEILGLMKAQVVKNALIVPSGAKGGFVLKALPPNASREEVSREVIHSYKSFIRSLLDITDNIKNNKIIHPKGIVCHDDDDPYLVVAADKGTATFSDVANSISEEYDFWLGDAFASGGRTGYDHKKMGITARGAWESVKRHFKEIGINVMQDDITVAGIGDMSGDVFGNGMLYTKHIKLVAAFDHRHIFVDPNPNPNTSYEERSRLFKLPTSSWENYNPKLISKGGGVFPRTLKSISITPEMKKALGIKENNLTPNQLIMAILKSPVDLVFNGGIGTYVKASNESNADVGDRTNDYCRVNGNQLRCRVVGEGGNLGFTQLARVEYALNGGLINTDFIDNSAGVDCSDHEVNLKILLDHEVRKNNLSEKKRDAILASLTDEVAKLVLHDNFSQALVLSFSAFHANKNLSLHQAYLHELESLKIVKRKVEFLPDDKTLAERKSAGQGFTRPELAVLLAYTKINIKQEILKSKLPEDPYIINMVETAFPKSIRKKYFKSMKEHPLHREIIATQLSNYVVNTMGFTYFYRIQIETGSPIEHIIRACLISNAIFNSKALNDIVFSLEFKIPTSEQYEFLFHIRNLINLSTRWFLHTNHLDQGIEENIEAYSKDIKKLESFIPTLMGGTTKKYMETLVERFKKLGLSADDATKLASYRAMYTSLNIIDVAKKHNYDLFRTAEVYFKGGERINLVWFRDQIAADAREGHWNVMARLTLRDELDVCQRALTVNVMKNENIKISVDELLSTWVNNNQYAFDRWEKIIESIHASAHSDYTMFFIAVRELLGLLLLPRT